MVDFAYNPDFVLLTAGCWCCSLYLRVSGNHRNKRSFILLSSIIISGQHILDTHTTCPAWRLCWHNSQIDNLCKTLVHSPPASGNGSLLIFSCVWFCGVTRYYHAHMHKHGHLCKTHTDWIIKWRGWAEARLADGIFIDGFQGLLRWGKEEEKEGMTHFSAPVL